MRPVKFKKALSETLLGARRTQRGRPGRRNKLDIERRNNEREKVRGATMEMSILPTSPPWQRGYVRIKAFLSLSPPHKKQLTIFHHNNEFLYFSISPAAAPRIAAAGATPTMPWEKNRFYLAWVKMHQIMHCKSWAFKNVIKRDFVVRESEDLSADLKKSSIAFACVWICWFAMGIFVAEKSI